VVESQNKTTRPKENKKYKKKAVSQNELETDSNDPSDDTFLLDN